MRQGFQKALLDTIEAFQGASTPQAVFQAFGEIGEGWGFKWLSCGPLPAAEEDPREEEVFFHYPEGWLPYYFGKNWLRHDPVVLAALTRTRAFAWSDPGIAEGLSPRSTGFRIMKEAKDVGLPDGFTIPVHRLDGRTYLMSVAGEGDLLDPRIRRNLKISALWAHDRLGEILDQAGTPRAVSLTTRERDCIMWAAEGKTDEEIGKILGISRDSVKSYILRVKQKFGVHTRIQAVVHAMRRSLID